jgi:large conductance mechanosensitive channel
MLKEFRDFAMRGNVIDLAVGVIIGGAFGKIITSFVSDVLMPPFGLLLGRVDFSNLFLSLNGQSYKTIADAQAAGAPTLNYGLFLNATIDFLIVAFVIFLFIRTMNHLQKPAAAPATKDCPYCFTAIPIKATRCPQCTSQL